MPGVAWQKQDDYLFAKASTRGAVGEGWQVDRLQLLSPSLFNWISCQARRPFFQNLFWVYALVFNQIHGNIFLKVKLRSLSDKKWMKGFPCKETRPHWASWLNWRSSTGNASWLQLVSGPWERKLNAVYEYRLCYGTVVVSYVHLFPVVVVSYIHLFPVEGWIWKALVVFIIHQVFFSGYPGSLSKNGE